MTHIRIHIAMKMTIEIPEDVLAELMQLTGHQTKREAVEFALREAALRAKRHRVWSTAFDGLTPEQLAADAAPKPSDLIDAPDIDHDAVRRALEAGERRRALDQHLARTTDYSLNKDQEPYGKTRP
jgi:Arc/MetJ family transcription regulator